jgi:hypothetical protein
MTTLPFEQLERAYERLATAIDRAGPEHEALFLTKLALTLAHYLGDVETFDRCVAIALEALPARLPDASSRETQTQAPAGD